MKNIHKILGNNPGLEIQYQEKNYGYLENLQLKVKGIVIKPEKYLKKGWFLKSAGGYYTDYNKKIINVVTIELPLRKDQRLHIISIFHEIAHHKIHRKVNAGNKFDLLLKELEAWSEALRLLKSSRSILPETDIIKDHILDSINTQIKVGEMTKKGGE